MSVIKGENAILYFLLNGAYKPIACMVSCNLTTNSELIETSSLQTGTTRTYRGARSTWSVSLTGLCSFDTNHAVALVRDAQKTFTPIPINFTATDEAGVVEAYTGNVLVTSISTDSAANDFYSYSIEATGNGDYLITDFPVDPNEQDCLDHWVYLTATGGGYTIQSSALIGKKIAGRIYRDGIEYRPSGVDHDATATPNGTEYKFNGETGVLYFDHDIGILQPGEPIDVPYTVCGETTTTPDCIAVTVPEGVVFPDAETGVPYFYSFTLEGDAPFTRNTSTKPSWMVISLNNATGEVEFSGTPTADAGDDIVMTFYNCDNTESDLLSATIGGGGSDGGTVDFQTVTQLVSSDSCTSVYKTWVYAQPGDSLTIEDYVVVSGNISSDPVISFPWDGALPHTDTYVRPITIEVTLDNGGGENTVVTMMVTDNTQSVSQTLRYERLNSGSVC